MRPQHDRPHRRLEGRDDRLARADLEPTATESCARCADREAGPCGTADQPARPSRTTNRQLHSQTLPGNERRLRPHAPVPDANRDRAPIGPTDDHARHMSRVAGLNHVRERLAVQLDMRVRPPEQSASGRCSAGEQHQPERPEAHPSSRPSAPLAPDRFECHPPCIPRPHEEHAEPPPPIALPLRTARRFREPIVRRAV